MTTRQSGGGMTLAVLLAIAAVGGGGYYYLFADQPRDVGRDADGAGEIAAADPAPSVTAASGLFGGLDGNAAAVAPAPTPIATVENRTWLYEPSQADDPSAIFGISQSDVGFRLTCAADTLDFDLWGEDLPANMAFTAQAGDQTVVSASADDGHIAMPKSAAWMTAAAAYGFTLANEHGELERAHSDGRFRTFIRDCLARTPS